MNKPKALLSITVLVLGSILIAGCSIGSNSGEDELEGLHEALSMTPNRADLVMFSFSNWQNGHLDDSQTVLNSSSSLGDDWMWGIDDLEWEAEMDITEGAAPVRLFKFKNEFDFAPVTAVYEERGFTLEESGEALLYTHERDLSGHPPILSHANTLFLPEKHIMLITSGGGVPDLPSLFEFYLEPEGKESLADLPVMAGLIQELENEQQVFVTWNTCDTLTVDDLIDFSEIVSGTESSDEEMAVFRDIQSNIHNYDSLGIGIHYEEASTAGKIVFGYDSAETAASDLPGRESLADLTTFSLDDIRTDGSNLILDVTDTNPEPSPLVWLSTRFVSPNFGLFLCP